MADNTGRQDFTNLLASIRKNGAAHRTELRTASNNAMSYFKASGDVTWLNDTLSLLEECPLYEANSLLRWAKKYAPLTTKQNKFQKNNSQIEDKSLLPIVEVDDEYTSEPFWDVPKEVKAPVLVFTMEMIETDLQRVIKKYQDEKMTAANRNARSALKAADDAVNALISRLRADETASLMSIEELERILVLKKAPKVLATANT